MSLLHPLKLVLHVTTTMLLLVLTTTLSLLHWRTSRDISISGALSEVNHLVPPVGIKLVRFPEQPAPADGQQMPMKSITERSYDIWNDVMPRGGGFASFRNDTRRLLLPEPIKIGDDKIFGLAVFHQLHCLHALQREFNDILWARPLAEEYGREKLRHIYHCIDYIRRSLMCSADAALEGQGTTLKAPGTSGEASYHLCRDYDAVKNWAESRRYSDMDGLQD